MKAAILIVLLAVLGSLPSVWGQPTAVVLLNPSFEDDPWHSKPPRGWYFCGHPGESPPDVHPAGYFDVDQPPADGDTYVGMVVRDNKTWEALGQRLPQPLTAGQCYRFSVQASRSTYYRSISRVTGRREFFTSPIRLRLWGGKANCDHAELLAASSPVEDTTWTTLTFEFQPGEDHHYLILEAFYPDDSASVYRGNILLDHCSPLLPIDCESRQPLAEPMTPAFPRPATRNELEGLIATLSRDLTFGYGAAALSCQYYRTPSGEVLQENLALHQLAMAVAALPEAQLDIALQAPGDYLLEERLQVLEKKLLKWGLAEDRFRLRPFRKRDRKESWPGVNRDRDIFIRLR